MQLEHSKQETYHHARICVLHIRRVANDLQVDDETAGIDKIPHA